MAERTGPVAIVRCRSKPMSSRHHAVGDLVRRCGQSGRRRAPPLLERERFFVPNRSRLVWNSIPCSDADIDVAGCARGKTVAIINLGKQEHIHRLLPHILSAARGVKFGRPEAHSPSKRSQAFKPRSRSAIGHDCLLRRSVSPSSNARTPPLHSTGRRPCLNQIGRGWQPKKRREFLITPGSGGRCGRRPAWFDSALCSATAMWTPPPPPQRTGVLPMSRFRRNSYYSTAWPAKFCIASVANCYPPQNPGQGKHWLCVRRSFRSKAAWAQSSSNWGVTMKPSPCCAKRMSSHRRPMTNAFAPSTRRLSPKAATRPISRTDLPPKRRRLLTNNG